MFMRFWNYLLIILWVVALGLVISSFWSPTEEVSTNSSKVVTPTISINYTNLEKELAKSSIVRAIPAEKQILLKFYSFNSSVRVWEKTYLLSAGKIILTNLSEADIVLTLDSKYLAKLTNKNFCDIIKDANTHGDLGFETDSSMVKVAWDFRSMKQYKNCLG